MNTVLILAITYIIFSQLTLLISAALAYSTYRIGRTSFLVQHCTKPSILGLFLMLLEIITLAILLPLLYQWFTFITLDAPTLWVWIFATSEILPAVFKYRKMKEAVMGARETIENPVYK